jgi:sugar/nucleoside kinase (ribokinase family)
MARKYDVAVMHDFFVDRLVHARSLPRLLKSVTTKAQGGGGGIHGVVQEEVSGGNAVNLAQALARLGLRTLLITHSGEGHRGMVETAFEGLGCDLRIKPGKEGLTVAFEEKVNVMLGDVGGAGDFGPEALDESDWDALERSKVVCSVNWAANRKGTELLVALRKRLGKQKTIFMDPADFRDNLPRFRALLKRIPEEGLVDWVSMNQWEGTETARVLGVETSVLEDMCLGLARKLRVVFDLHAVRASYTSEGTRVSSAKVNWMNAKRLTGAGDVWDAGAIYGRLKGMTEVQRLEFANRAAKAYLESDELVPPKLEDVMED